MEKKLIKNIEKGNVLDIKNLVSYQEGQIVSKTLIQNDAVSLTLFAFDADEEISTHKSHGDALIQVLEGTASITVGAKVLTVAEGESVVMPAEVPHAVQAKTQMKFFLTVVF